MDSFPAMPASSRALEARIAEQVIAVFGGSGAVTEQLRPIVQSLVAEELPRALAAAMPDIIREIDLTLSFSLSSRQPDGG